ncbi:hypothetical protein PG993_009188 [Apiospora rasikravindrae]|uniref:DUF7730 domain-containing protein n=1 Tax=Apiospora rasikravindrae TaxID=990691 RepID=A0ABR1SIQ4_9PEZI
MARPYPLSSTLEAKPQPDSLFLSKLPAEIRLQVYEHVFGYRHLHIFIYEQRLVCLLCQNPTATDPGDHEGCIGMSMSKSKRPWNDDAFKQVPSSPASEKKRQHLAALLTVCHTMYLETVDDLYRSHVFHFSNIISMAVFPREIIPHYRDMLHHVRIDLFLLTRGSADELYIFIHNSFSQKWPSWEDEAGGNAGDETPWECAWGAIAGLTSLHTLRVTIEVTRPRGDYDDTDDWLHQGMSATFEKSLFEPLTKITCNNFLLRVNWPAPPMTDKSQQEPGYPFRIERFTSRALE